MKHETRSQILMRVFRCLHLIPERSLSFVSLSLSLERREHVRALLVISEPQASVGLCRVHRAKVTVWKESHRETREKNRIIAGQARRITE